MVIPRKVRPQSDAQHWNFIIEFQWVRIEWYVWEVFIDAPRNKFRSYLIISISAPPGGQNIKTLYSNERKLEDNWVVISSVTFVENLEESKNIRKIRSLLCFRPQNQKSPFFSSRFKFQKNENFPRFSINKPMYQIWMLKLRNSRRWALFKNLPQNDYISLSGTNRAKYSNKFCCMSMLHLSNQNHINIFSGLRDLEKLWKLMLGPFSPFKVRISKNPLAHP